MSHEEVNSKSVISLFNIIPEFPYTYYLKGRVYARIDLAYRKYIDLVGPESRFGTTYARYLMSVHLGRRLEMDEEVDHINNDCTDDRIDNYQILTRINNSKKASAVQGQHKVVMLCPTCQQKFVTKHWFTNNRLTLNTVVSFCSQRCATKFNQAGLSSDIGLYIRSHQTLYDIRTHWFEYEDWYHQYYPHTEILKTGPRELLTENGKRCKDIPGLTEYCWDIFTPKEERLQKYIELAQTGMTLRDMQQVLHTDRKLISQALRKVRPDLVNSPSLEVLLPEVKALLESGMDDEFIADEVDLTKQQLYDLMRRNDLYDPNRKTKWQKDYDAKLSAIKDLVQQGFSNPEIAKRLNVKRSLLYYLRKKYSL